VYFWAPLRAGAKPEAHVLIGVRLGARTMAIHEVTAANGALPSTSRVAAWFAGTLAVTIVLLLAGVGVAAVLGHRGTMQDWNRLGNVGQTFGVLSSIISGLALAVVVVIARVQFREMQASRAELEQQRHSLARNHLELQRTAEANLRMVHLEIMKMSVDDPELAAVWPPFETNPSVELNRQYLYANIIYQFHWTSLRVNGYNDEEVLGSLRYLFRSPIMRGYWRAAALARTSLEPGGSEETFARRVDELCSDYEAVAANATRDKWPFGVDAHEAVPRVDDVRTKNEAA
jgi:uncharacterized membrane protein